MFSLFHCSDVLLSECLVCFTAVNKSNVENTTIRSDGTVQSSSVCQQNTSSHCVSLINDRRSFQVGTDVLDERWDKRLEDSAEIYDILSFQFNRY